MGNTPKFYLHWVIFGGTLVTLLYMFNNLGSGADAPIKRYFLAVSVVSLISLTFSLAKNIRDRQDAKRMRAEYRTSHSQASADL